MNIYLYFFLLVLMLYLTYRNFQMIKRNKVDKGYVDCYKKVIANDNDALEYASNYVANEKIPALRNKALVMKLIQEMVEDKDYTNTLNELSIKDIIYDKKGFSNTLFEDNTDVFLWIMTAFAKANKLGKKDVIEGLYKKLEGLDGLDNRVEVKLVESLYKIFTGDKDTTFITNFLIGEYEGYVCDKKVISLNKRFAEAIKDYCEEELDEVSKADIPNFQKTALGEFFMKDLGTFDKYEEKEESYLDETKEEE